MHLILKGVKPDTNKSSFSNVEYRLTETTYVSYLLLQVVS